MPLLNRLSPNIHPGNSKIIQKKLAHAVRHRNNTLKNKHSPLRSLNYRNGNHHFNKYNSTLDLLEELNETRNAFEHIEARLYKEFPPLSQRWPKKRMELLSGYDSVLIHLNAIEKELNLPLTTDKYNQNSMAPRRVYETNPYNTNSKTGKTMSKSRKSKSKPHYIRQNDL